MSVFNGTSGNDPMAGSADDDTFNAFAGSDRIDALDGRDTIILNDDGSTDTIDGGAGWDHLHLRLASNQYEIGLSNNIKGIESYYLDAQSISGAVNVSIADSAFSLASSSAISVGGGGSAAAFKLDASGVLAGHTVNFGGGSNNDTLLGGAGNDNLNGGAGNDSLVGGAGDDSAYYNFGQQSIGGLTLVIESAGVWLLKTAAVQLMRLSADSQSGKWTVTDLRTAAAVNSNLFGEDQLDAIESIAIDAQESSGSNFRAANLYLGGTKTAPTLSLRDVAGTAGNDTMVGTGANDQINAFTGSDRIDALDGNDNITIADDGSTDTIDGGAGWDHLHLRLSSNQYAIGSNNNIKGIESYYLDAQSISGAVNVSIADSAFSLSNISYISVGSGGNAAAFKLDASGVLAGHTVNFGGGSNNDTLLGGAGNDNLNGGAGNDSLVGGAGDDSAYYNFGQQSIGGLTLVIESAGVWLLKTAAVQLMRLSADSLSGKWTVTDLRTAAAVNSNLYGEDQLDAIESIAIDAQESSGSNFRAANVYLGGTKTAPTLSLRDVAGTAGNDTMVGTGANDQINAFTGSDRIDALDGNDNIIIADDGSTDTIDGGAGWDNLNLRLSSNQYAIGSNNSIKGIDNYYLDAQSISGAVNVSIADSAFSLSNITYISVGSGGSAAAFKLDASGVLAGHTVNFGGGSNNDTLLGGAGNDNLNGGAGNDSLVGGAGDDSAYYNFGQQSIGGLTLVGESAGVWLLKTAAVQLMRLSADSQSGKWTVTDLRTAAAVNSNLYGEDQLDAIESIAIDAQESSGSNFRAANLYLGGTKTAPTLSLRDVAGTAGNDTMVGTGANDQINAFTGSDRIDALDGNDNITIADDGSTDTIDGGAGWDDLTLSASGTPVHIGFGNIVGVESWHIYGGAVQGKQTVNISDALFSSDVGNNVYIGGWGGNASFYLDASTVKSGHTVNLSAAGLNDTLVGGAGNDSFSAGGGCVSVVGGDGVDTLRLNWQVGDPTDLSKYIITVSSDGLMAVIDSRADSAMHFDISGVERVEYYDYVGNKTYSFPLASFLDPQTMAQQALVGTDAQRWNANTPLGTATNVSFSFVQSQPTTYPENTGFRPFSAAEKQLVRDILARTAEYCGIKFVEVTESGGSQGQMRFGVSQQAATKGVAYAPDMSASNLTAGDVWMDVDSMVNLSPGSEGYAALLHEIGHALGLRHPRNVDPGDAWSQVLRVQDDSTSLTVMSVVDSWDGLYRADWGMLDVAALRYLYGNKATRVVDDTYQFGSGSVQSQTTLVDDGGNDLIDAAGTSVGVSVDLAPGHTSSIGLTAQGTNAVDNVGIAPDTWIEAATGSVYDDVLIGNSLDNLLTGLAGNDWIDGGKGVDTVVLSGSRKDYFITTGFGKVFVAARDGVSGFDTLIDVEKLKFSDQTSTLVPSALGADLAVKTGQNTKILGTLPDPTDQARSTVSFSLVGAPERGSVSLTSEGNYAYVPLLNDLRPDSFSYKLIDVQGKSNTYIVFVEVVSDDTTSPTAISFSPNDGASAVLVNANIVIDFDKPIGKGVGTIFLRADSASAAIVEQFDVATSTNLSISGSTLTINPTADLGYSTGYKLEFAAGTIKDIAGNSYAGVSDYNFTTGSIATDLIRVATSPLTGHAYDWKTHTLLSDVDVKLTAQNSATSLESKSSADGKYGFELLDAGSYQLDFSKALTTVETGSAINSADALAALKIAVGRNPNADPDGDGPLTAPPVSPYQFIAADANQDGKVTSADALAILKMAVKRTDAPAREWLFVNENQDFWNETTSSFTTTKSSVLWDKVLQVSSPLTTQQNVVAVLKGDVNGSWTAPTGSQDLDLTTPSYFTDLAAKLGTQASQWAVMG